LNGIIGRLQAERWRVKPDTGYSDYDLEIMGGNWTRLRLTTVSEELEHGRRVFRCRIGSDWTFRSHVLFWISVSGVLAIVGVLAKIQPWLWMLPCLLPVLQLFLEAEKGRSQAEISALLDQVAAEYGLKRLSDTAPS
jgi:hypothetical protein